MTNSIFLFNRIIILMITKNSIKFVRSEQKWQIGRHSNYSADDGRDGSIFCMEMWTMCFIIIFEIQFKLNDTNRRFYLEKKN